MYRMRKAIARQLEDALRGLDGKIEKVSSLTTQCSEGPTTKHPSWVPNECLREREETPLNNDVGEVPPATFRDTTGIPLKVFHHVIKLITKQAGDFY